MTLRVFNSMTQIKEEFMPLEPGRVTMYTCGPTVYDHPHIGNWRCFVVFDTVRRYLEYLGYRVKYVQNFTDIDDKVIKRASELGITTEELAKRYIDVYFEEAKALNIQRADEHPRATEHIPDMVRLIEVLVDKGFAYQQGQDVYFDTTAFPSYGIMSRQALDSLEAGARVGVDGNKRNPLDFVLWKGHKPGEPSWPSPWGRGRPGWHLECSVMAMKHLGGTIDIHAGGIDLKFPHHENERVQSEAASGKPFAKYWLHNGFLNIDGQRMGKSLGNIHTLKALIARFQPEAIRFFLLSAHYRSPLTFSSDLLASAQSGLDRLYNAVTTLKATDTHDDARDASFGQALNTTRERFTQAMNDDFNTADALSVLFDLTKEVNAAVSRGALHTQDRLDALKAYEDLARVLGLLEPAFEDVPLGDLAEGLLDILIEVRQTLRKRKDWDLADRVRDGLVDLGIQLEDTEDGVRWKRR